jgi:hypothetical protein
MDWGMSRVDCKDFSFVMEKSMLSHKLTIVNRENILINYYSII